MTKLDATLSEQLEAIGLSDKAAQVYAYLIETGGAFPSAIAEATGLNRSTTYKLLVDLSIKGLVSELRKRNKLYYQVDKPEQLERFTKSQISLAKKRHEQAIRLLPDLEGLYQNIPHKPRVRFFEGTNGVQRVYEDHIAEPCGYEMVGWSNVAELQKFLAPSFLKKYILEKQALHITSRAIFPDTDPDRRYHKTVYKHLDKKYWPKCHYLSQQQFPFQSEITVYGTNKVSLINFHDTQPIGVIIEDETMHQMLRMIFECTWKGTENAA